MPKVHSQKAGKDYPEIGVKKGETYYWWQFRYGGKRKSKTYPKASQLTQSEFKGQMYELEERITAIEYRPEVPEGEVTNTLDDIKSEVEEIVEAIRALGEECDEKRSNMPDHLQDVGSGEILQNRYDECESWASELEGIDLELDDPFEEGITTEEKEDRIQAIHDAVEELHNCSYNGE